MPEYQVGMYVEWNKQIWEIMGIGTATSEHPAPMQLRNVLTNEPKEVTWTVPVPCCPRCRQSNFPKGICMVCGLELINKENQWIQQDPVSLNRWLRE